jgi:hypothetical protein
LMAEEWPWWFGRLQQPIAHRLVATAWHVWLQHQLGCKLTLFSACVACDAGWRTHVQATLGDLQLNAAAAAQRTTQCTSTRTTTNGPVSCQESWAGAAGGQSSVFTRKTRFAMCHCWCGSWLCPNKQQLCMEVKAACCGLLVAAPSAKVCSGCTSSTCKE